MQRKAFDHDDTAILRATIAPVAADPAGFGRLFYRRLFDRAPAVRSMFPVDPGAQERKLAETLVVMTRCLDEPDGVEPLLRRLGEQHRDIGALTAHYNVVGYVLLEALAEVNGALFAARAQQAWRGLYGRTVAAMQSAAR